MVTYGHLSAKLRCAFKLYLSKLYQSPGSLQGGLMEHELNIFKFIKKENFYFSHMCIIVVTVYFTDFLQLIVLIRWY